MKLNGKTLISPNIEIIPIPRGSGEADIIFKAKGLVGDNNFDKLCPPPEPSIRIYPGGKRVPDLESPEYQMKQIAHYQLQQDFLVLKSLEATEGLEWETVDMNNPETWKNFKTELRDSGFNNQEIAMIINGCLAANALDEEKIEAARQRFLASQQALLEGSTTQKDGQPSTQSSVPASE